MSHTCVMPSTFVHCGVNSVMPWTMWTGSLRRHHREDSAAELVERLNAERLPDHLDRRAAAGHVLANRELLIDLPVLFVVELADQPLGEEGPPQIVVQHDDVFDAVAAVGLGRQSSAISPPA